MGRKSAIRKLAKKRSQWENAATAAKACREGWSSGVEYFERVQKECLGATAAATGHDAEVSIKYEYHVVLYPIILHFSLSRDNV